MALLNVLMDAPVSIGRNSYRAPQANKIKLICITRGFGNTQKMQQKSILKTGGDTKR